MPEEIPAAFAMLLPSIVCLKFMLIPQARESTCLAAAACIAHCPFSFTLHMHRAFSTNAPVRTRIFKFDATFIHVHALVTGFAWSMKYQFAEIIYHGGCILHIITSDPLNHPKVKNTIDIMAGLGVVKSSFGLIFRSIPLWISAIFFWVTLFTIHDKKLAGAHSAWIMHVMLALPQYCMLDALQNYDPTWALPGSLPMM